MESQNMLYKAFTDEVTHSFGEGFVLNDGLSKYDKREDIAKEAGYVSFKQAYTLQKYGMDISKALTTVGSLYATGTSYSATSGSLPVLIPVYVDPEIVDLTRRATPLVELIPRVTNYGKTADYNQIYAIATAQALAEDASLTEQDDTYYRKVVPLKFLYSVGRITGPMFAASKQYLASGGYVDALSLEVKNKTLALKRLEEAMILLGDGSSNWTEPVNSGTIIAANSYNGLYQLISNANSNGLGGSASYKTDNAGAALSIAAIRTAIRTARTVGGEPNLMVCDYATYDVIKSLIQDQLRYVSTTNIAWGITTVSFEGIPLIASRFLSTTAGTGSGVPADSRSLFVLDTNVIEMRVLQDVSYEELAKTNDSIKFMLKCYEALVCKAPQFCHVIIDIGA